MVFTSKKSGLKRELGLIEATLYGVGIILGAGIYALVGKGAGLAGNSLWLSFAVAAIIAAFTGLSYAELSSMFPKTAAEYNYTLHAFKRRMLSIAVGLFMVAAGTIGAATVGLGFAGYFSYLFGGPQILIASLLIIVLSIVNYIGIRESSKYNILATLIEAGGLILVIAIGLPYAGSAGTDFFGAGPAGSQGIVTAAALIFFAYIGFENVANMSEEAKDPKRTIPRALIFAIIISTILYILVAISAVSILGWEALSVSEAPLTEAVAKAIPEAGVLMSLIALFATSNTVLALLIVSSRILYGMSRDAALAGALSKTGPRGTPHNAIIAAATAAIFALFAGRMETVAMLTNLGIFAVYFFVNASLIFLRYKAPNLARPFKAPLNFGRFPVLAFFGAVSCIVMIYYIFAYFAR